MILEIEEHLIKKDGVPFVSIGKTETTKLNRALSDLYASIWIQSSYDPDNEITRKYASTLLPFIQEANRILKFKE